MGEDGAGGAQPPGGRDVPSQAGEQGVQVVVEAVERVVDELEEAILAVGLERLLLEPVPQGARGDEGASGGGLAVGALVVEVEGDLPGRGEEARRVLRLRGPNVDGSGVDTEDPSLPVGVGRWGVEWTDRAPNSER